MESNISIEYNYLLTKIYGTKLAWCIYTLIERCLEKYILEQSSKLLDTTKNINSLQDYFNKCIYQINEWSFDKYQCKFTFPNLKQTFTIKDCAREILCRIFEFYNINLQMHFITSDEYEHLTSFNKY